MTFQPEINLLLQDGRRTDDFIVAPDADAGALTLQPKVEVGPTSASASSMDMVALLVHIIVPLIIVGLLLWVLSVIPGIDPTIKQIIKVVIIVVVVLWLLLGVIVPMFDGGAYSGYRHHL